MDLMDYYNVEIIKNAVVTEINDDKATVIETVKNYPNIKNRAYHMFCIGPEGMPSKHIVPADHIIVSVGYTPERTLYDEMKGEHVYLIGEAENPSNVINAIWKAYEIALKL